MYCMCVIRIPSIDYVCPLSLPGIQSGSPHRPRQEGDDLSFRDARLRGGEDHRGGQKEDDADPPGGTPGDGLLLRTFPLQEGVGRYPQVRDGRAVQG